MSVAAAAPAASRADDRAAGHAGVQVDDRRRARGAAVAGLLRHRPPAPHPVDGAPAHAARRRDPVLALDDLVLPAVLRGRLHHRDRRHPAARAVQPRGGGGGRSSCRWARWGTSSSAPSTRARCCTRPTPTSRSAFMAVGPAHRSARQRVPVAARRAHHHAGAHPAQGPAAARAGRAGDGDAAGAVDADHQAALHRRRRCPATCSRSWALVRAARLASVRRGRVARRRRRGAGSALPLGLGGGARRGADRRLEVDASRRRCPLSASCGSIAVRLADDHHQQRVGVQQLAARPPWPPAASTAASRTRQLAHVAGAAGRAARRRPAPRRRRPRSAA